MSLLEKLVGLRDHLQQNPGRYRWVIFGDEPGLIAAAERRDEAWLRPWLPADPSNGGLDVILSKAPLAQACQAKGAPISRKFLPWLGGSRSRRRGVGLSPHPEKPNRLFRPGREGPRPALMLVRVLPGRMHEPLGLGSFVTAKKDPDDIDAVLDLPSQFSELVDRGHTAALELEQMILTRRPEELFAAEDEADWQGWCEFFSRTREADGRRKGLVEITL